MDYGSYAIDRVYNIVYTTTPLVRQLALTLPTASLPKEKLIKLKHFTMQVIYYISLSDLV
jgi:hypothetical protein